MSVRPNASIGSLIGSPPALSQPLESRRRLCFSRLHMNQNMRRIANLLKPASLTERCGPHAYFVQPFMERCGKLVSLSPIFTRSGHEALCRLQVLQSAFVGVVVLRRTFDPLNLKYGTPEIVATVGKLPAPASDLSAVLEGTF